MNKITFIIGTRPELIKVAPVILELKRQNICQCEIVNSAQHKDLLDPYWNAFGLKPDVVLDLMKKGQSLSSLTSRAINQIQAYIDECNVKPSIILSQGDTTTVMASSIVCFYNQIKFAHLEAGLRSFDFQNPFPEEFNRRIAGLSAAFHFAPTEISAQNLIKEHVKEDQIFVVGNTVIDALELMKKSSNIQNKSFINPVLEKSENYNRVVPITCHRRENQGKNLLNIIDAIYELAEQNTDTVFIWAVHPNPNVKNVVESSVLKGLENVILTEPLQYFDLIRLMMKSQVIITDSGGIQEEAPSFKVPTIVLRERTERPEGVNLGYAFLVGADKEQILERFNHCKEHTIDIKFNPYGDGQSSARIVNVLKEHV